MTALRVCFVGDSVTQGTADNECLGWAGRLGAAERARGHDLTVYNLGVRADTSRHVLARWHGECEARLPAAAAGALVFAFGINDAAEEDGLGIRVADDDSVANARAIIATARDWLPTLWIGPTPAHEDRQPFHGAGVSYTFANPRTAELNVRFAALAAELGVPYLDLMTPLMADGRWPGLLAPGDGVHPSAAGYARLAATIGAWPPWRAWFD